MGNHSLKVYWESLQVQTLSLKSARPGRLVLKFLSRHNGRCAASPPDPLAVALGAGPPSPSPPHRSNGHHRPAGCGDTGSGTPWEQESNPAPEHRSGHFGSYQGHVFVCVCSCLFGALLTARAKPNFGHRLPMFVPISHGKVCRALPPVRWPLQCPLASRLLQPNSKL